MSKDLAMLKAIRDAYRARFHALLEAKGPMNYDTFTECRDEYQEADAVYLGELLRWNSDIVRRANKLQVCSGTGVTK